MHPIIEEIVIEDLDGEETGNDILDKYAAVAAKKYNIKEDDIRETLKGVIPFTPVGPAPDGALIVYCGKKLTSHRFSRTWSWTGRPSDISNQEHVQRKTKP